MNKSKFLKKSLAMVLAIMMVVAMIPLGASAADAGYVPTSVTVKADSNTPGTVTGSGTSWNVVFDYDSTYGYGKTLPKIDVELGNTAYLVKHIKNDGSTVLSPNSGWNEVEFDKDNNPIPFTFKVVDDKQKESDLYTINWSVKAASSDTTIKSAKLDSIYTGVVDETNKTVTFTVPFKYSGAKSYTLTFNSKVNAEGSGYDTEYTASFNGTVGTNEAKAVAETVDVVAEDDLNETSYDVYVIEEKALTTFKIGDMIGVFGKKPSGTDEGYEDGSITFNVPADVKPDTTTVPATLKMVPTFTVGSAYTEATLDGEKIESGVEFNFYNLYNTGSATLELKNKLGNTKNYTIKMNKDESSTEITSFTAKAASGSTLNVNGSVSGSSLTVELSSKAVLDKVKITIEAAEGATITIGSTTEVVTSGKASFNNVNCESAVPVKVVAKDGKHQQFYTLTVTKASAVVTEPKVTSMTMTLYKDTADEYVVTAQPSGNVITLTVPYSTPADDLKKVKDSGKATYTYTKSAFSTTNLTVAADPYKDGATLSVTSDNGDSITYTVKYQKAAPETGKTMTALSFTKADNVNLVNYTETYKATLSNGVWTVKVPASAASENFLMYYELPKGAALYSFANKGTASPEVVGKAFDDEGKGTPTNTIGSQITGKFFMVVDETLAVEIANDNTLTYEKIANRADLKTHYTAYEIKSEPDSSKNNRIQKMSANDGAVTTSIAGDKITMTVPYGYVDGDAFFIDFTLDANASIVANPNTGKLVSGGVKIWNATDEKVEVKKPADASNPDFKVVKDGDEAKLQVNNGSYTDVTNFTVTAANGTVRNYDVEIKVLPAETGASLTDVKVGKTAATISGKSVSVVMPYGSNLGAQTLELTASKNATIKVKDVDSALSDYDTTEKYNLTGDVTIAVTAEDTKTTNIYTLKATVADQFKDVTPDDWFYDEVMQAAALGLVSGTGNGYFSPKSNVTRGDFALMIARMEGYNEDDYTESAFVDIDSDKYYSAAVAYCVEKGYLSGYEDGTFKGDKTINRQEIAKILAMVAGLGEVNEPASTYADDAKIANWAKGYVYAVTNAGLMSGVGNNNFAPTNNTQRCQAAAVLVRLAAN